MIDLNEVLARIEIRCRQLGRKSSDVARAAGKADAIRNMRKAARTGSATVTLSTIAALAEELGVKIGWLISGEEGSQESVIHAPGTHDLPKSDGKVAVVERDYSGTLRAPTPAIPNERTFREHLAELRADSVRTEQAIAVVEGAMLSAGLKPELLAPIRQVIQECLEEPLDQPIPEAEFAARRAMAKVALAQFLKQGAAQTDKE